MRQVAVEPQLLLILLGRGRGFRAVEASEAAWYPTLSASAQERFTNAIRLYRKAKGNTGGGGFEVPVGPSRLRGAGR